MKAPLATIDASALAPGAVLRLFREGALAVIVRQDPRVAGFWRRLVASNAPDSGEASELLPWCASLDELSGNHRYDGTTGGKLGDMVLYAENTIGYVARKLLLTKPGSDAPVAAIPEHFTNGGVRRRLPEALLRELWSFSRELTAAVAPDLVSEATVGVTVERLKYDSSSADLRHKILITRGGAGRWARLGRRMDAHAAAAAGPFDRRGVRDAYALTRELPFVGRLLGTLNDRLAERDPVRCQPDGWQVVGQPHTDDRLFSALCSERSSIRTEVFDGSVWHPLPMGEHDLVLLPGIELRRLAGVPPTLHRVLVRRGESRQVAFSENVTLLFGVARISKHGAHLPPPSHHRLSGRAG